MVLVLSPLCSVSLFTKTLETNFVIGIYLKNAILPLVSVVFYMVSFALGPGGTMPLYCAEIIPPVGMGISNALQWLAAFLVAYLVPLLKDVSIYIILSFFVVCNILSYFFTILTCIETKGLTEAEIIETYNQKIFGRK